MMKLSPTGGGSAMQGLEIFEKPLESTSQVEPRAEGEQVVTKRFRGLERQSRIQGIVWRKDLAGWRVQWWEGKRRKACNFSISNHMKLGLSEGDASEAALEEAKAFREELARLGKLKPPKPITENAFGSTVKGVFYNKQTKTWRVQVRDPATDNVKKVGGGFFKVKEEAEAGPRAGQGVGKAGGGGAGEAALRAPTLRAAQAGEGNQVEPAELLACPYFCGRRAQGPKVSPAGLVCEGGAEGLEAGGGLAHAEREGDEG